MKKGRLALVALILSLAVIDARAVPIIFEIRTEGWLASGPLITETLSISFRYAFDSNSPDVEPSPIGGSYAGLPFALLKIGSESSSTINDGAGIFTDVAGLPTVYGVGAVFPSGSSHLLGRELVAANFSFLDIDGEMLSSDALPLGPGFAQRADSYVNALFFVPILGDPEYGGPGYTKFAICDPAITDTCVYAPLTLARIGLAEPGTLLLFPLLVLLAVLPGRRARNTTHSASVSD
jgi:hypothetical protein